MPVEVNTTIVTKEKFRLLITVPLGVSTYSYIDTIVSRWAAVGYKPGDLKHLRQNVYEVEVIRDVADHIYSFSASHDSYKDLDDYDATVIQPALGKAKPNVFKGSAFGPAPVQKNYTIEAVRKDGLVEILERTEKGWYKTSTGRPADMNEYTLFRSPENTTVIKATPAGAKPTSGFQVVDVNLPTITNNSNGTEINDVSKSKLVDASLFEDGFDNIIKDGIAKRSIDTSNHLTPKAIDDMCP